MSKYEEIIEWASRRSVFYPSAEIYANAPAGLWNFGPYGEAIRRKIIEFWRKELVQKENMLEVYGAQIMPEEVFKASGHLSGFNDPFTKCSKCNCLYRADEIISEVVKENIPESLADEELNKLIQKNKIRCSRCKGELEKVKRFNMMVKVDTGVAGKRACYLRPEACQSVFLDFDRMMKTMRVTLPKGVAQVGRAFRNEISPRQSLFREIEFSQFEAEIFFNPDKIDEIENFDEVKNYKIRILFEGKKKIKEIKAEDLVKKKIVSGKLIAYYLARTQQLYENYGISKEKIRFRVVGEDERPFYSKGTFDLEIETALGWMEVIANNYRTDYDLKGHSKGSKKDLSIVEDGKKFTPHIWEISGGVDRTFYAVIDNAFKKEKIKGEERTVLNLNPKLAPFDSAVLPLVNKDKIPEKAKQVLKLLRENDFNVFYDDSGSIGRRYRRLDEVGVTGAITIDYDSLKNNDVTLRDRNTLKQIRVKIKDLPERLRKFINGERLEKLGKIIN
jgi:glycyl-tRNA synthetase